MKVGKVTVCVSGAPGMGRRTLLAAAAAEAGIEVIEVDARKLAKAPALLKKQLKMIARECTLLAHMARHRRWRRHLSCAAARD